MFFQKNKKNWMSIIMTIMGFWYILFVAELIQGSNPQHSRIKGYTLTIELW